MNTNQEIILSTKPLHGRCIITVWETRAGYINANDVRDLAAQGLITIVEESGNDSLSAKYGRTTFVFTKN